MGFLCFGFMLLTRRNSPIFQNKPVMALKLATKIIPHTGSTHSGTVIFLHGSGDTGHGVHEWISHLVPDFTFPHMKVILPTAPKRPYAPLQGELSNVWFDRKSISKHVPEDLESIDVMAKEIVSLIQKEVSVGVPMSRIVVGGFSMGGALSLHVGYRHQPQVAGVFALSSFINDGSALENSVKELSGQTPPLFQWHGERDDLVPFQWGEQTFRLLESAGVNGEFHKNKNALHELKKESLVKLQNWINNIVKERV